MARDEMEQITEDRWDENIWGVEHEDVDHKYRVPKLVFYFGEKVGFVLGGWWVKADERRIIGLRTILEMR
jgi:hypothetical protein